MTFVTYTPFDTIGTAAGLNLLEKLTNGLWHGSFLGVSILAIFVFLSLAKIARAILTIHFECYTIVCSRIYCRTFCTG